MNDSERKRHPHCIVWCPLPVITTVLPFIGKCHLGITTSNGDIHDFSGPYTVSKDNMAFCNNKPTRVLKLDPLQVGR
ncbi:unnamed protein product [Chrysoparadoxa australica]